LIEKGEVKSGRIVTQAAEVYKRPDAHDDYLKDDRLRSDTGGLSHDEA
jgi:hypothetical protein